MTRINLRDDPHRFVHYYHNQVGGGDRFQGAAVQYGRGIGSIFSKLFRFVSPLVKSGFALAKPHLKRAATNIASDVIGKAMNKITGSKEGQEGSGIMVLSRRPRTRPPGERVRNLQIRRALKRKKSNGKRRAKARNSARSKDIFQ